jgi:hypothetical protein
MPDEATTEAVTSARPHWRLRNRPLVAGAAAAMALLVAAVATWLAPPGRPSPRYSALPDPCALVSAADIGRYVPGAQKFPPSLVVASGLVSGSCSWSAGKTVIGVQVTLHPSAADAATTMAPRGASPSMQPVAGLGDRAVANLTANGDVRTAYLSVQSGNAVIGVSYGSSAGSHDAAVARSAAMALASAALASLPTAPAASAVASGFPASARPGKPYASPASACALVRPALLASSLPGATVDTGETASLAAGSSGTADCSWTAASGTLKVDVAVLGPAPASPCLSSQSEGQYSGPVIPACPAGSSTAAGFYGPGGTLQRISGLGDQATAYFAVPSGPPLIILTADSGNAVVTVEMHWTGHPARTAQLAETTAIVRDVLGALPRSR